MQGGVKLSMGAKVNYWSNMKTFPTEKLFYDKFGYKVLLKQQRTKKEIVAIKEQLLAFLDGSGIEYNVRTTRAHRRLKKGTLAPYSPLFGFSVCFNEIKILDYIKEKYSDFLMEVHELVSDKHKEQLIDNARLRVRPLYFKKYNYCLYLSRFKARQKQVNLGFSMNYSMPGSLETGTGELQEMLAKYDQESWHISENYNLRLYTNDINIVTYLRMRYEDIIDSIVVVKTPEEVN